MKKVPPTMPLPQVTVLLSRLKAINGVRHKGATRGSRAPLIIGERKYGSQTDLRELFFNEIRALPRKVEPSLCVSSSCASDQRLIVTLTTAPSKTSPWNQQHFLIPGWKCSPVV